MEKQQTQAQLTCPGEVEHGSAASPKISVSSKNFRSKIRRLRVWEQARDVKGLLWDVREIRRTHHDFDLLFGFPARSRNGKSKRRGGKHLIATPALVAYWQARRANDEDNFDLPASRSTITRVRTELGFGLRLERRKLWQQRIPELKELSIAEFAKRYQLHKRTVSRWRQILLGSPTCDAAGASCESMEPNS